MALTVSNLTNDNRPKHNTGDLLVRFCKVQFDSVYPTGGEPIVAADFGLTVIMYIAVNNQTNVVTKQVWWDDANSKLMIVADGGTPAEVANGSDQSAVIVQLAVYGY